MEPRVVENMDEHLQNFTNEVTKQVGEDNIVSIIGFGPWIRGEPNPEATSWIVLKGADIPTVKKITDLSENFGALNFNPPLVTTHDETKGITDSFPLPLYEVLSKYRVLFGDDIFKDMKLETDHLRGQVELQLRSRVLVMRQRWIDMKPEDKVEMEEVLMENYQDTLFATRIACLLKGGEYLIEPGKLIESLNQHYGEEKGNAFNQLKQGFEQMQSVEDLKQLEGLFFGAVDYVSDLLRIVDEMGD